MDKHAIEVLELASVIHELGDYAFCDTTASRLQADFIDTQHGFSVLAARIGEFKAACALLRQGLVKTGDVVAHRVEGLGLRFDVLEKEGAVLELEELSAFHRFVRSALAAHATLSGMIKIESGTVQIGSLADSPDSRAGSQLITGLLRDFPQLRNLEQRLSRYLSETGQLREDSIPELRTARMRVLSAQSELRKAAQGIVQEKAQYTSAEFATIRDGRMVIPLKADFKGRVPGIIHQSSATGATLFVEPFELVERNNACAEAEAAWIQAVQAVLRELSATLSAELPALQQSITTLQELDLLYCRARYSQMHDCFPAETGSLIRLEQARHPLLGKKAIPIDIQFVEGARLVVISGPNTGGKTVALKTLGLLALMNQAGMDIPAGLGSTLPLFGSIFADIGDEQSISASLSTFSGHVSRIASFLSRLDSRSLVLLDELGSGTDPEEGGALAIAVTEHLLASGCSTLITSHHGALKALAYGTEGASNASMEFSQESHSPTYRVINGIPGQSHALDIARRVGMLPSVLDRAEAFLNSRETPLEDLVQKLGDQYRELRDARQEVALVEAKLQERDRQLLERERTIREQERELKKTQVAESSAFLREARSTVEARIRELDQLRSSVDEERLQALKDAARASRDLVAGLSAEQAAEEAQLRDLALRDASQQELRSGMEVWIRNSNQHGVLDRELRPGRWLVSVKNKNIEFRAEQLQLSDRPGPQQKLVPKKASYVLEGTRVAAFQLDVRGLRFAEVQEIIIRQIDAAMVQGMDFFSVIHGKGEGILQKAIHDYLKECPGVERFEFARPEDGGSGKTLIYLRH